MKTIMIKGEKYKIKILNKKQSFEKIGKGCAARCYPLEKTIYIDFEYHKNAPREELFKTLYHEVWHCLCIETGLNQIISNESEEISAEAFSSYIVTNFFRKKCKLKKF